MLRIVRNKFIDPSFGRAFVVTFFFVTLAAGLFWLDFFRSYSAEVTLLVVTKSGTTETSGDVATNMADLVSTLSFYDRVLNQNDLIDDETYGYAPDKRKTFWNDTVSVMKQDASGVLVIRTLGDTPEKAKLLASQTAQTLFSTAGLYYNVKTEVDMRIVDGPLVSYSLQRPWVYGTVSILSSFLVTSFFFFLLRVVPELIGRKKEQTFSNTDFGSGESIPWIDPKKFIPEKTHTLSFENSLPEGEVKSGIYGARPVKHAEAPANLPAATGSYRGEPTAYDEIDLPIASLESLPFQFEALPEEVEASLPNPIEEKILFTREESIPSRVSEEVERGEPTLEEYKRRLNELLTNVER